MSLVVKALVYVLFFSLLVVLIALLPLTSAYPLPPEFASSLTLIFGYYFAWSSVFTVLNTLLVCAGLGIGLELVIWVFGILKWIAGIVARFVG